MRYLADDRGPDPPHFRGRYYNSATAGFSAFGQGMRRANVARLCVIFVVALWSVACQGFLITPINPARVDFTLGTDEVDPGFELPAWLINYTVEFDAANGLNLGEGYQTATFTANGTFLGSDSYINTDFGNIIGCACTDVILNPPLDNPHFFVLLTSLAGTFEVTNVIALAYDCTNGCGDHARAFGHIHAVPVPPTLPLVLLAMSLIVVRRHRLTRAQHGGSACIRSSHITLSAVTEPAGRSLTQ